VLATLNKSQRHEQIKMKKVTILDEVKNWINDEVEDTYSEKKILEELQQHGCVSGMVGELIYYSDTCRFYNKYRKEIFAIIENYCVDCGYNLCEFLSGANNFPMDKSELQQESFVTGISGLIRKHSDIADQIKNWFSWFAFEETAFKYYSEKYEN
jgi:hypothetical protein